MRTCAICQSRVKGRGRARTCSAKCAEVYRKRRKTKLTERACEYCQSIFAPKQVSSIRQRFCGRACFFENKKVKRQHFLWIECRCGVVFDPFRASNRGRMFCSRRCRHAARRERLVCVIGGIAMTANDCMRLTGFARTTILSRIKLGRAVVDLSERRGGRRT